MIKVVKKLKFWSRKKKKKKVHEPYYPPSSYHCCCSYTSTQPSAPPLPSWFESEQTHEAVPAPIVPPIPDLAYPNQAQIFHQQEIVVETTPLYPTLPASIPSYQQYMVPNPVYGMPVVHAARRERSAGLFGCFVNFGIHLVRCLCPCFRIREVN